MDTIFQGSCTENIPRLRTTQINLHRQVGGINKLWSTQTVEYYSVVKRKNHLTTWMPLKCLMPSEEASHRGRTVRFRLYKILETANYRNVWWLQVDCWLPGEWRGRGQG